MVSWVDLFWFLIGIGTGTMIGILYQHDKETRE